MVVNLSALIKFGHLHHVNKLVIGIPFSSSTWSSFFQAMRRELDVTTIILPDWNAPESMLAEAPDLVRQQTLDWRRLYIFFNKEFP